MGTGTVALKMLGCICIISASSVYGWNMGMRLQNSLDEVYDVKFFFILLRSEIDYMGVPLYEAFEQMAGKMKEPFASWLIQLSSDLQKHGERSFYQIWKRSIERNLGKSLIPKKIIKNMIAFGNQIGFLDRQMQLRAIDMRLADLHREISRMEKETGRKKRLYRYMGVSAGVFICILLG